ncbi:MAG: glycerate kinase [Coprobacillaceae bacterium]
MKIVIAPDSFKESMSAKIACEAIEKGIHQVDSSITCYKIPMADGGEGTLQSICDAMNGKIVLVDSFDLFCNPMQVPIGICDDIIVIESASCIGLDLVSPKQRDIWKASTYGLGITISKALDYQPKKIIICLGGSATNDAGMGMLNALGAKFLDANKKDIQAIPLYMNTMESIDITSLDPRLQQVEIVAACDVQNPLCGKQGASYVFGPQKGATKEDVQKLDVYLQHFGNIASKTLNKDIVSIPGGGAAGGLGSSIHGFLKARLQPGIDIVKEVVQLENYLKDADLVISGEGSLDEQTLQGKTCYGILQSAKKYNVPMIIFAGNIKPGAKELYKHGVLAYFPIVHQVKEIKELLMLGPQNLTNAVENVFRLWYGIK